MVGDRLLGVFLRSVVGASDAFLRESIGFRAFLEEGRSFGLQVRLDSFAEFYRFGVCDGKQVIVKMVMELIGRLTMEKFLDLSQDQHFKDWLVQHPNGFYLNIVSGKTKAMLHKVGCFHLGYGEGVVTTTNAKFADDNLHRLLACASKDGMTFSVCRTCAPD